MMRVAIENWCAWSPGIEDESAWREWALEPRIPARDRKAPAIDFVPSLQRRRCDALTRMLLHVARGCCPDATQLGAIPVVFASRHGPLGTTVSLLEDIAANKPLSPTAFSHSVHNTALGLFSIWMRNQSPSVAVAARRGVFAHGYIESLAMLQRSRSDRVLFVTADESIPEELEPIADEQHGGYAVALLLARSQLESAVTLRLDSCESGSESVRSWPDALEFVRWWINGGPELRIARGPRLWTWTRGSSTGATAGSAR
jgi:hypothetical protein